MKPRTPTLLDLENDPEGGAPGPYDTEAAEDDLWFLPAPAEDEDTDPFAPPLPRAPRATLLDPAEWQAAEAALAQPLAELALDLGRLVERAEALGPGAAERLAHAEAASLSWWTGDRIGADRIALWLSWRIGATGDDAEALLRTAWAARRLSLARPSGEDRADGIARHLGLESDAARALAGDVAALLPGPGQLGAVATGCAAFHLWRLLDERPEHLRESEAAVLGARLGLGPATGNEGQALGFLPLSLAGIGGLTASGTVERKLAAWIAGAHHAVLAALMTLERLRRWQAHARAATADLSGRTPGLLIDQLMRAPMLTVPQLVEATGASRHAIRHNLGLFLARGLVREVTGQGRFQIWSVQF